MFVFQRVKFVPTFISTLFFVLILKVEAREQHEPNNVAAAQVTVTLLDENDNIPKFTSDVYEGKVFANQTEGLLLVQVSEFYSIRHTGRFYNCMCIFFNHIYSFACIAFNHTNSEKYFFTTKKDNHFLMALLNHILCISSKDIVFCFCCYRLVFCFLISVTFKL